LRRRRSQPVTTSGEVPETLADKSKTAAIELPAGRYVMYCNMPGHYAAGMYGTFVTE
jgi:uncharacterized cupredoxin-like copper-binding protein